MFGKTQFSTIAACGLLTVSVNAHVRMANPVPFVGDKEYLNYPLAGPADFPCHYNRGYEIVTTNQMKVNEQHPLVVRGSAVHGGGSCQISITLDEKPDLNSEWRVIHSMEGSCPSTAAGNLPQNDANYESTTGMTFSIPDSVPSGKATLAWTWFNKIGNREMYMNCAPIQVTGGAQDSSKFETLPFMFVSNIFNSSSHGSCSTSEGQSFVFPDAGTSVQRNESDTLGHDLADEGGACKVVTALGKGAQSAGLASLGVDVDSLNAQIRQAVGAPLGGSSGGSSSGSSGYSSGGSSSDSANGPANAPVNAPAGAPAIGTKAIDAGGVARPTDSDVTTSTTLATVTATPAPASASSPAVDAAPAQSTDSSSSNTNSSSDTNSSSCEKKCDNDGAVVCFDADHFGLCNAGCVVKQQVSYGTHCKDGAVLKKRDFGVHMHGHINRLRSF